MVLSENMLCYVLCLTLLRFRALNTLRVENALFSFIHGKMFDDYEIPTQNALMP